MRPAGKGKEGDHAVRVRIAAAKPDSGKVLAERLVARIIDRTHFERRSSVPAKEGSLFAPSGDGASVSGGWTAAGHASGNRGREAGAGGRGKVSTGWKAAGAAFLVAAGALAWVRRPTPRLHPGS